MTKINDYIWQLPHTPLDDDPPDINILQQDYNLPIAEHLKNPLGDLGYELKTSDIAVRFDEFSEHGGNMYTANVRFIRYLTPEIIVRVHFEHDGWAHTIEDHHIHRFYINLDRMKLRDVKTQMMVSAWGGRIQTRMSNRPGILHRTGDDQLWQYASAEAFDQQMELFLSNFVGVGQAWLEDPTTFG